MPDEVLRWLGALDCTEKHNDMQKLRQQGTCTWFPNTDAYTTWRVGRCRMAKVRYLVLCESPRLIPRIHRRLLSWLRKVCIDVSSSMVHTRTGVHS